MRHFLKAITLFNVMFLVATAGFCLSPDQDNSKNPPGCSDVGYRFDLKVLQFLPDAAGQRQSMYLLFNKGGDAVNLYHMRSEHGTRNLYLNHSIKPGQWAVFSTSEHDLKFICTAQDKSMREGRILDCADTLRVCELTNVKYGLNNRGNYWLVNSDSKNGALRAVVRYGIIPAA